MTALQRAELAVVDSRGSASDAVEVQFNPASLSLQMANSVDGGTSRGRQTQQYNGSGSTTLSLVLEFDTADEGTTQQPVDVRTRTAQVARFVLPGGEASRQAPPRVRFRWGTFELVGVMSSLTEELSLFAASGTPLRAKTTIQIKEQDPRFEALERGPGANGSGGAAASGEPARGTGPGTSGGGPTDRAAEALAGETPADFLARNGLAPEAWRAVAGVAGALGAGIEIGAGIELEAGLSVDFSASLSLGAGVGASAGFRAGLDATLGESLGLAGGPAAGPKAGFALSEAGGVTAASETAAATSAAGAAADTRDAFRPAHANASFTASPGSVPSAAGATSSPRAPLAARPATGGTTAATAPSAPLPPRADRRATSFGHGVPLRDRVVPDDAQAATGGYVVVGRRRPR